MSGTGDSGDNPVFQPQTWTELLQAATARRDMFSAKTLMVILEGIEQLSAARQDPNSGIQLNAVHAATFEKLRSAYNNGGLLKSVGALYLGEFHLPGAALKHFQLARQFSPGDHEIEPLETAAGASMALHIDQQNAASLEASVQQKPDVSKVIFRTTTKLHRVDTRMQLNAATGALERRQEARRKTQSLGGATTQRLQDFSRAFAQVHGFIENVQFADAFSSLVALARAAAPADEIQTFYAQLGLAAFENNRLADALSAYLKMRDMAPQSVEGWYNCGLVYHKMGMSDEALDCYEEASRLDPTNPRTWCNLASIWFDRGEYTEAETMARKALEIRPDYPRALDNLAAALSAMDRLQEAADICQQAIRLQPNLHSAWFKLGVIKFQQEQFIPAMEAFNLTGDNPDFFSYVLYYLCMIDARRGRLEEAIQKLGDARAADPANDLEPLALKEIGALCTKQGHHQAAADSYTQILSIHPEDAAAWLAKGTAHHQIGQFADAHAAYMRVTELEPENSIPWHNLGLLASDQGHDEEACHCYQREVDLAPDDPKAWHDLGAAWKKMGNQVEAHRAHERADDLARNNTRRTSDLSAAMSIVRRLNLGDRVLKTGEKKR